MSSPLLANYHWPRENKPECPVPERLECALVVCEAGLIVDLEV